MFWNENADKHLLPWLDKRDLIVLSLTCQQWQGIVSSRYLFSTILTAIKEVVVENNLSNTPAQKKKDRPRMLLRSHGSKFSRRFNMGGSGITPQKDVKARREEQVSTSNASTQISSTAESTDLEASQETLNQWIRVPALLDHPPCEDPAELVKVLRVTDLGMLHDYTNLWSKTIEELLNKLRDTVPDSGMLGEVHYWRDLCRILDGISSELKQSQVELSV